MKIKNNNKLMKHKKAMSKKNFGQINLKKTLASCLLIILLTEGAISKDWNKITPIIILDNTLVIYSNIGL